MRMVYDRVLFNVGVEGSRYYERRSFANIEVEFLDVINTPDVWQHAAAR